jgi:hypothetical protein
MDFDETLQEFGKFLADVRNNLTAINEAIDTFLDILGKSFEDAPEEKPYDSLPWEARQGNKGPFEMTSAKACGNNDLFRHLQLILKQNNRRYTEKGWNHYYWLGQNDDNTIFRRRKGVGKTNE